MPKVLVTGARGQLGQELQQLTGAFPALEFRFFDRDSLDITQAEAVRRAFEDVQPDYCINCAAYTAVDKAESEPEAAFAINAGAVEHLARACAAHGTRLVHLSTDYVFNGEGQTPYGEDAPTDPVNLYGRSKLRGEQLALSTHPDTVVLRTSWVYSPFGHNFVKTMLRLMHSRPEVSVVADQVGAPTYARDLAEAILQIVQSGRWLPGIYHYSNEGVISWWDFAQAIRQHLQFTCTVHPIPTEEYPTAARRPRYSVLGKEKIQQAYGIRPKPWLESLHSCLERLGEGSAPLS